LPITTPRTLALAAFFVLPALPAAAAQFDSAYTELNLDECTVLSADDFGAQYACPGYKGIPMFVAEGDLRYMASYGFGAPKSKAAGQTLPPFNVLAPTIEWRVSNAEGGWKPFATIVRYLLDDDETEAQKKRQVLVVTRFDTDGACQIAWIDAKANADANALARQAADEKAKDFDCSKDPEIIGRFEAWKR